MFEIKKQNKEIEIMQNLRNQKSRHVWGLLFLLSISQNPLCNARALSQYQYADFDDTKKTVISSNSSFSKSPSRNNFIIEKTVEREKGLPIVNVPKQSTILNSSKDSFNEKQVSKNDVQDSKERDFSTVLSSYKTKFNANQVARSKNIAVSAEKINGTILQPGEEFSFDKIVGPRTKENGFEPAPVFVGSTTQLGYGGGICQTSSTLYVAALQSDLEITERRAHGQTVSYMPLGLDATISWGSINLRFKNTHDTPIKILCEVHDGEITVSILSKGQPLDKQIEFESEIVKEVKPTVKKINDNTLPKGTQKVSQEGKTGYTVKVYKIVKKDGEVVSKTHITTSTYRMVEHIILVGTK